MVSIHPVSLGLLGASISEEKVLEQHDSQSTFEGMFTVNLVVRALSARRLLHLGGPHLQGVLRLCPRSDLTTFKKLSFAEPRMFVRLVGWSDNNKNYVFV